MNKILLSLVLIAVLLSGETQYVLPDGKVRVYEDAKIVLNMADSRTILEVAQSYDFFIDIDVDSNQTIIRRYKDFTFILADTSKESIQKLEKVVKEQNSQNRFTLDKKTGLLFLHIDKSHLLKAVDVISNNAENSKNH